jgi:hypothetical protein
VAYVIIGIGRMHHFAQLGTALGSFAQNPIPIFEGQGGRTPADLSSERPDLREYRKLALVRRVKYFGIWDLMAQAAVAAEKLSTSHSEGLGLPEESTFSWVWRRKADPSLRSG